MFTGLVETVGTIRDLVPARGSARIGITCDLPLAEMVTGESVSVDGVCLTVSALGDDSFHADAVQETLDRTTLGRKKAGDRVNLERALRLGDRLGGHMVQGHVDGISKVREVVRRGNDCRIRLETPPELRRFLAEKGSVAIQGVSLTVSRVETGQFEVALIPETLDRTTLGTLSRGDPANVEVDLIARYLDSLTGRAEGGYRAGSGTILGLPTRPGKARDR